jgi:hypothetical protein
MDFPCGTFFLFSRLARIISEQLSSSTPENRVHILVVSLDVSVCECLREGRADSVWSSDECHGILVSLPLFKMLIFALSNDGNSS